MNILYKRALHLEYFTVGYNAVEAAASILFGVWAGSIALIGFGLDSIVESLSGLVLVWRLLKHGKISGEEEERIEGRATKFVAVTFLILGFYVLIQSLKKFIVHEEPDPSLPGIILAAVSVVIMPILAAKKMKIARAIESEALMSDAKETIACTLLSVSLIIGLGANYLFGLWQADPLAGLIIVIFLFKEGVEGLRKPGSQRGG